MSTALILLIAGFVVFVLPLLAFIRASRALAEIRALRRDLDALRRAARAEAVAESPPQAQAAALAVPEAPSPVSPPAAPTPPVPSPALEPAPAATRTAAPAASSIPPAADAARRAESLEARIGSRWLLYLGVAAIVIAASYFVKLAFDNHWITETMRVAIGAAGGVLLVWLGGRFVRAGYALYGQMLAGGGIAILYLSIYAAFNYYALVGQPTAFALMLLVTALAAWQADRHRSQGLAVMAVGGGFLTPFLVGGRTDAQAALFGYDAILVAGTAALARRRAWPILNLVSYGLALVTIGGWLLAFYTPDAYLRTVLFLTLFCALFAYILAQQATVHDALTVGVRRVLATGPPLYYVVSVALLYPHSLALLLFLIAATFAGIVLARRLESRWGPVALWIAVGLPLLAWADTRAGAFWLVPGATVILAIYALHLVAQLDRLRRDDARLEAPDIVLLHLNGIGPYVLLHLLLDGWHLDWLGAIAAGLAGWHLYLRGAARRWHDELPAHFAAVTATLAAVAATRWLGGDSLVIGWTVETAALTAIGLHIEREWLRVSGAFLLGLAAVRLLGLLFGPIDAHYAVLFNAKVVTALLVAAAFASLAFLHRWRGGPRAARIARDADFFALAAHLLILVLATTEINAFFELRGAGRPASMARAASLAVAWTLQGLALVRLGLSRERAWLRLAGAVILFVPIGWLVSVLWVTALANLAPPAGYVVLVNARAAAALTVVAALYGVAAMHRRMRGRLPGGGAAETAVAVLTASVITLGLLSAEIGAFWRQREVAASGSYEFARQLSLSVIWAAYAAALIFIGIRRRYRPIRYFAIATFLVTILKVLVVDLSELERLYRVLSVAALGLLLLVASYLYQRFRDRLGTEPEPPTPPRGRRADEGV